MKIYLSLYSDGMYDVRMSFDFEYKNNYIKYLGSNSVSLSLTKTALTQHLIILRLRCENYKEESYEYKFEKDRIFRSYGESI